MIGEGTFATSALFRGQGGHYVFEAIGFDEADPFVQWDYIIHYIEELFPFGDAFAV